VQAYFAFKFSKAVTLAALAQFYCTVWSKQILKETLDNLFSCFPCQRERRNGQCRLSCGLAKSKLDMKLGRIEVEAFSECSPRAVTWLELLETVSWEL